MVKNRRSSRGRTPDGSPNPIDVYVGARVKMRRTLLGMSQEKLGEAIGLTFQQVQKYERGLNRISASRLFDISKVLEVPIGFFFEEMDEMVYISDPESYEILSMNRRLRESLGYNSNEECRGKKCYKVLQGLHRPCAFCTNGRLAPGQHVSWMHRNPMLNKNFLIKDTLVQIMDKSYRVEF